MKDIYSVGQINRYIKGMFNQDILLRNVYIRGEVSNCKYHSSGHIYFSLKDASGTLSCIMFAGNRRNLQFPMKNGDRVICGGTVDVYEKGGSYQLYARDIRLEGAGLLYEQFIALRNELKEMGMFEKEYKKPIPKYAMKVGVVTAPEGAAIRDIQNISHRRNPYVQLYLYPARVQGEGAKASIVRGIRVLDDFGVDVIIIGRGGGSLEDLWAFNEREVADGHRRRRPPQNSVSSTMRNSGREQSASRQLFGAARSAGSSGRKGERRLFCLHFTTSLRGGSSRQGEISGSTGYGSRL